MPLPTTPKLSLFFISFLALVKVNNVFCRLWRVILHCGGCALVVCNCKKSYLQHLDILKIKKYGRQ